MITYLIGMAVVFGAGWFIGRVSGARKSGDAFMAGYATALRTHTDMPHVERVKALFEELSFRKEAGLSITDGHPFKKK